MNADHWMPLSVRESPRFSRKRFWWWQTGVRHRLALWLAPWIKDW